MPFITRKTIVALAIPAGVAIVAITGFVWSGIYNIGADDHHWRTTYAVLEALRERSIDTRAGRLQVPADLAVPARIRQGAGNYAAMCTGCHLAPGMQQTELSKGLYPAPPDLTRKTIDAAHAFWVIKHGIKASGMPAWGMSMDDEYIWNMTAFLQELPKLDRQQYEALVASSEGHSHGGGETQAHEPSAGMDHGATAQPEMPESKPHTHAPGTPPHDHTPKTAAPAAGTKPHSHAPGTPPHDDGAKPKATAEPAAKPAEEPAPASQQNHDEHDHQH